MSEPINDRDQFVKDTPAGLPVNETGTTPAPRRRRSARYENQDVASAGYEPAAQAPRQTPAYDAGQEVSGETRRVAVPPRQGYPSRSGAQGYPRQGSQQWYGQASGAEGQRPAMPPQGYSRQAPQGQQAQGYGRQAPQGQQAQGYGRQTPQGQQPQGYGRQPVRQNDSYRQPPRGYEPPKEEEPEEKKHSKAWLVILLVLLLLIAACFGLYHLVPQDQEGVLGQARNAVAYVVEPVEALVVKPTETPTPEPTAVPTPEPTEVLPEETPEPDEPDEEADDGDEAGTRGGTVLPSVAATETEKPLEESVSSFMASNLTGTAPQQVSILVRADNRVVDVRMVDADGEAMKLQKSFSVDGNFTNWLLLMQMDKGYKGDITLEVTDGNSWVDTGYGDYVDLADPIPAATDTPAPTATQVTYTATPSPDPTATPTPKPTKTPEPTRTPVPTNTPEPTATPTPAPTEAPKLDAAAAEEADPAKLSFDTTIYDNTKKLASYARSGKDKINMQGGADYSVMPMGVLTFRGDSFRRNAVSGTVEEASSMEVAWTADASSVAGAGKTTYYGIGWYGQPAIVKWSKEVREKTNMTEDKRTTTALKEVIVAGMDGRIYFLDLADGNPTRDAINVGYPMRGTPSIHPSGYPIMTVGQYARKMKSGTGKIGLRFYDMLNQAELPMIDGLDAKNKGRAYNEVGSFNSSALIDTNSDTLITVGTNGLLYLTKLGTKFDYKQGSLTLNTSSIVLKNKTKKEKGSQTAVDSSLAMYGDYAFYADTAGVLRCVDVNTLSIVWAVKTGDTVQGAVALDFDENGDLCVYCANLLSLRAKGTAQVYCFDAATGARKWVYEAGTKKDTKTKITAGFVASPVIGENDLADLCYFTVTGLTKDAATSYGSDTAVSALVALNKKTGSLVWSLPMSSYAFSSPIALYTTEGEGRIVQAESNGTVHLLDGLTGKEVNSLQLEGTIEASPAAYGDMMVIGTTGKDTTHIYGIRIK